MRKEILMKLHKWICGALTAFTLTNALCIGAAGIVVGDVNGDGTLTVADAVTVSRIVVEDTSFSVSGINPATADVTNDGILNAADILWILNRIRRNETIEIPLSAPPDVRKN